MGKLMGLLVVAVMGFMGLTAPHAQSVPAPPVAPLVDYADLVERLSPAVVNIATISKPKNIAGSGKQRQVGPALPNGENPFAGTPFAEMFEQFNRGFGQGFGDMMTQPRQSLGTGVIISADGFVVTNNHVVEGADAIVVKLNNSRDEYPATLVGRDTKTDLALLKIKATKPLPAAKLGTSANLRVGQAVLAIGNPFGLGGTVTSGIVSALARNIGQGPYDDFIQTDVAINPGNSGGPLFNVAGDVVGINTAIFSRTGGSNGISFAIPVDAVKQVVAQLQNTGRVARGYMGVKVQALTPSLAQGLGLTDDRGALVAEVTPGSPAVRAGIREGDVILTFNSKAIGELNDLPKLVAATPVGTKVRVDVLRNGKPLALTATVAALPDDEPEAEVSLPSRDDGAEQIGLLLSKLTPVVRDEAGVPEEVTGMLVLRANGAAQEAGLKRGDVIAEADWRPVHDATSLKAAVARRPGQQLLLRVWRADGYLFLSLKVPDEA